MVYCTDCGTEVDPDAEYCSNCGERLSPEGNRETPRADGVGAEVTATGAMTQQGSPVTTELDTDVLGHRVGAIIIDWILVSLVVGVITTIFNVGAIGFVVIAIALYLAYFMVAEAKWGQTPGKVALGIRVVSEDGTPISDGQALSRNLWRFIDGIGYYLVGFVFAASSNQNQRLGDRRADTLVVRDSG